jgi:hypothetical protein
MLCLYHARVGEVDYPGIPGPRSKELFQPPNISIYPTHRIAMDKAGLAIHPIRQLGIRASLQAYYLVLDFSIDRS